MTPGERSAGPAVRIARGDELRFLLTQAVPFLAGGAFRRRRLVSRIVTAVHPDPAGLAELGRLRERYGSELLWLDVGGTRTLLVLDPAVALEAWASPPDALGPSRTKVQGMRHFQPRAVTTSVGDDWARRRALNEDVLGSGDAVHPSAPAWLEAVEEEVRRALPPGEPLTWTLWEPLWRRIAGRVLFGRTAGWEDAFDRLRGQMERANRSGGRVDPEALAALERAVAEALCPPAGGLAERACPHAEGPGGPEMVGQVPHWMFALADTLAANAAHVLAAVVAHPRAREAVLEEVRATDLRDPAALSSAVRLRAAFLEAMRLWPTTPLLVRAVRRSAQVGGVALEPGQQVMVPVPFLARDPRRVPDADAFAPDRWDRVAPPDPRFAFFGLGAQGCAGAHVALLLGTAVVAHTLRAGPWVLARPPLRPGAMPQRVHTPALRLEAPQGWS